MQEHPRMSFLELQLFKLRLLVILPRHLLLKLLD
jgi:hypothetical protein